MVPGASCFVHGGCRRGSLEPASGELHGTTSDQLPGYNASLSAVKNKRWSSCSLSAADEWEMVEDDLIHGRYGPLIRSVVVLGNRQGKGTLTSSSLNITEDVV